MKNNYLIVANWKLNPETLTEAKKIFNGIKKTASRLKTVSTVVCAPYIFIPELKKLTTKKCALGVQDIAIPANGAHTGLVSASMVKKYGVGYSIVGHSEVRARGESDEDARDKIITAIANGITPILCVGERTRDSQGFYWHIIKEQVTLACTGLSRKNLDNLVIAYEPVWAIGQNAARVATPAECFEVIVFIRKVLSDIYSPADAQRVTMLYGGSVTPKDALGFVEHGGVAGYLVGRASLSTKDFSLLQMQLDKKIK